MMPPPPGAIGIMELPPPPPGMMGPPPNALPPERKKKKKAQPTGFLMWTAGSRNQPLKSAKKPESGKQKATAAVAEDRPSAPNGQPMPRPSAPNGKAAKTSSKSKRFSSIF